MTSCTHTVAEHDAMKADATWSTLEPVGYQPGDDEHGDLEMRNAACGSTLARRCLLTEAEREQVRAASRAKGEAFRARVQAVRVARAA